MAHAQNDFETPSSRRRVRFDSPGFNVAWGSSYIFKPIEVSTPFT
jgi:hypothetical protein